MAEKIATKTQQIIILPGWTHTSDNWSAVSDMLSKDFSVTTIDLPGFGKEPYDEKILTAEDYANWVTKRIATLSKPETKNILLGHSFGGRIASYIASENPSWLTKLILYASPSIYRPSTKLKLISKLVRLKNTLFKGKSFGFLQSDDYLLAKNTNLEKIFKINVKYDQTEQLRKISKPTLLLWGENDNQVPIRIAREISKLISNSELVIMPNFGHNAHIENPNLFYGYVKKFIEKI